MGGHHHDHSLDYARHALYIALALNFGMFIIEVWQGLSSNSTSLIADSVDFLSDSFSYVVTLYVLEKSLKTRAYSSLLKAILMLCLAAVALSQGVHNLLANNTPQSFTMGWVAALALVANFSSAFLLYRTRKRDSNMESVWLCSRNDSIASLAIIIAAFLVHYTGSMWPDMVVALIITWLASSAALKIIIDAKKELRHGN